MQMASAFVAAGGKILAARALLRLGQPGADEPAIGVFADDRVVLRKNAEVELSFWSDKSDPISNQDHDRSIVAYGAFGPFTNPIAEGLLSPRVRESWIAPYLDPVAGRRDRHDQLGAVRFPFRSEPVIDQPHAVERAALGRSTLVNAAAAARLAVHAPDTLRLVELCDRHHLAAKGARAAGFV